MPPGQLCSSPLHKFLLSRPGLGCPSHVEQVAPGPPSLVGELALEVCGKPVNDLRPPARCRLALEDVASDGPVQPHHLSVGCASRTELGLTHSILEGGEEVAVAGQIQWAFIRFGRHKRIMHGPE